MDLRQLRYLIAVVHERSFSRAADQLSMTQPPLSTSIAQLERELGVPLLDRHSRGVEPTEAGQYLVDRGLAILADLEDAAATVRAVGTGRRGRLAIATSSAMGWELLPALLRTFDASSRDVETEIRDAPEPEVLMQVRERVSDVGLVYCSRTANLERLVARDLEVAMIRREPLFAVLPADHVADQKENVELASLGAERWMVPASYDGYPGLAQCVREAWDKAGIAPRSTRSVGSLATALRLVEAGLGIAMMPSSVTRVTTPAVAAVPLSEPLPPVEAAVVWHRHERQSPVLARFLRAALWTVEPDRLGPTRSRPAHEDD